MNPDDFVKSIGGSSVQSPVKADVSAKSLGGIPAAGVNKKTGPTWWDNVKNTAAHLMELPNASMMELSYQPLRTLEAIPKGLLASLYELGRPIVNLPHTINSHIPLGTTMAPSEFNRRLGIEHDAVAELAALVGIGAPAAAGERLAVKGVSKALPFVVKNGGRILKRVLPAARNTATRAGYWGAFSKLQGGSGKEGAAVSALADVPLLGKSVLGRIPLKMAEKEARYTTEAGAHNPETRTPEEAKQIMQLAGSDFPTSLGTVSGSRKVQKLESAMAWLPFSTYNRHMESGLYNTDQVAQQLVNQLRGDSSLAQLGDAIHTKLHQARKAAYNAMEQQYAPIEKALNHVNFKLTDLPSFRKSAQDYLTGEAAKAEKGIRSPLPDFTPAQQTLIKSYLQKPKSQLNPLTFQYETAYPNLSEARQLESDLKAKARDEGHKGNTDTQKAFNTMAAALRKDYAHNAEKQGLTNIVPALEKANRFAKSHYYDVWEKPDIHNLLNGKSNQFYTTLMKRQHNALLDQLPQPLKHKIFLSNIAHRIREGQLSDRISPANLSSLYGKQGLKDADAKSKLLDAPTRKQFKRLLAMNELTRDVRVRKAHVPTGKMLMPVFKYGSAGLVGLGSAAHPWLWAPLLGTMLASRKAGRYLMNPKTIDQYTGLSGSALKNKRFKIPFKTLGVASTQVPSNE